MADKDGSLEWWNQASEELLGLQSPNDKGQQLTNLVRDPRFINYLEKGPYSESVQIASPVNEKPATANCSDRVWRRQSSFAGA